MSELVWGIKNGVIEDVKEIFERDQRDVNSQIDGRPPLLYAADYGQKHIIQYLLDKGANVNAEDKHGISALLAAVWEGHTECVRLLLTAGADRAGKTPDGQSYVDVAEKQEIKALLSN